VGVFYLFFFIDDGGNGGLDCLLVIGVFGEFCRISLDSGCSRKFIEWSKTQKTDRNFSESGRNIRN
jgi:hypothetical protein